MLNAGWSSPVAREAHNLEVVGSNPAPATFIANSSELAIFVRIQLLQSYSFYQSFIGPIVLRSRKRCPLVLDGIAAACLQTWAHRR